VSKVKHSLIAGVVAGLLAGNAVGVVAQDATADPMAPALVTGEVRYASSCQAAAPVFEDGVQREHGYRCAPQSWSSDDARLGGATAADWNADVYEVDGVKYSVTNATWDIQGERGGGQCAHADGLEVGNGLHTITVQGSDRLTCIGNGDNTGLSAILIADWGVTPKTFEGLIFPGSVPPPPDAAAK
jgi:hypothetical protein